MGERARRAPFSLSPPARCPSSQCRSPCHTERVRRLAAWATSGEAAGRPSSSSARVKVANPKEKKKNAPRKSRAAGTPPMRRPPRPPCGARAVPRCGPAGRGRGRGPGRAAGRRRPLRTREEGGDSGRPAWPARGPGPGGRGGPRPAALAQGWAAVPAAWPVWPSPRAVAAAASRRPSERKNKKEVWPHAFQWRGQPRPALGPRSKSLAFCAPAGTRVPPLPRAPHTPH